MTMKIKQKQPEPGTDVRPERRVKGAHLKFDGEGREIMDPTPIAPPLGYKRSKSISEQIREMVRSEKLRQEAEAEGYESFEDADDFEIGDFDPRSPYEEVFEPLPEINEDDRLKTLGDHIGNAIYSKLGGEQPLSPEEKGQASLKPPGSGAPSPNPSPPSAPVKDAARTKAEGFLKPRST